MTIFLRLLADKDKGQSLREISVAFRTDRNDSRLFQVNPGSFQSLPGAPFAYWVSEAVREAFKKFSPFQSEGREVRQGLATADDFRFVRTWWEPEPRNVERRDRRWFPFTKGGIRAPFYSDVTLALNWHDSGMQMKAWADPLYGNSGWSRILKSTNYYFRPGLTWPLRGVRFSSQAVPRDCIFSVGGKMAFSPSGELDYWLALFNSLPFNYFIGCFAGKVGGVQYEAGLIGRIPAVAPKDDHVSNMSGLARRAWSLKRTLDTIEETSHAFLLPTALRVRLGDYDPLTIEAELARIQAQIDATAFDLYSFSEADRAAVVGIPDVASEETAEDSEVAEDDSGDDDSTTPVDQTAGLLSWAVGVSFGRFDWRLATGERAAPPEPDPFYPLPAKSPGMLPDGAEMFHAHPGILVDDPGHPHDITRQVEEVLTRVDASLLSDVRRWLQREFFPFHLQRYSKSRRKAPIYWPLSTLSGGYTLWLYYPSLTSQTLYTAVNDFIDGPNGKLKQVGQVLVALRNKGNARSREDEKSFEALQTLELELLELRDSLLQIAPTYRPNHDDGVQITAAGLWRLFRHKPWQRVLKETWGKLENGDYDWAHLAMAYWPDRVREKCKTDKSLAIAHRLENLYVEPSVTLKKKRGKQNAEAKT